jgi:hypothetical protein
MRLDGTIQPDLSVIDWREMRESTPRGLRRPTPQDLEGQVALAAALLATHLLYEGDVKVILKRRLGLSAYACSRLIARARVPVREVAGRAEGPPRRGGGGAGRRPARAAFSLTRGGIGGGMVAHGLTASGRASVRGARE